MTRKPQHAHCVEPQTRPLTFPEVTLIIVVIVLAVVLSLAGMPTLGVLVLLGEACSFGVRLVRRMRRTWLVVPGTVRN